MARAIPEKFRDLLEKKAFAHLATLMPDGSPQSTPVWVSLNSQRLPERSMIVCPPWRARRLPSRFGAGHTMRGGSPGGSPSNSDRSW